MLGIGDTLADALRDLANQIEEEVEVKEVDDGRVR